MVKGKISKRYIVWRWLFWAGLFLFLLANIIAYNHAYKFTHFSTESNQKTKSAPDLSTSEKLKTLFFGINYPRPQNKIYPATPYQTIRLRSNKTIEGWLVPTSNAKGIVIIFHGYGGNKSLMLDKSSEFQKLGYSVFLIDFMGTGNSEGNQTTIGFHEAEQVKTAFNYIQKKHTDKTYLFGTSMGAVAILKALANFNFQPDGIIIECPFGSMYQTTLARFKMMGIPAFPMAGLLVFWGGVQNNFWAFGHNPTEYAKKVKVPVLLMYGQKDPKVSYSEITEIYKNLGGKKQLKIYPEAGHENYLIRYKQEWVNDVSQFLTNY